MQDGWPDWARDAWRTLTNEQARRARLVWTTLAREFDGVLVGPWTLVRHLVEQGRLGHRSTLETLGLLAEHGLLEARRAAEGTVLWIPGQLLEASTRTPRGPLRPRFLATSRCNGGPQPAQAEA